MGVSASPELRGWHADTRGAGAAGAAEPAGGGGGARAADAAGAGAPRVAGPRALQPPLRRRVDPLLQEGTLRRNPEGTLSDTILHNSRLCSTECEFLKGRKDARDLGDE